MFRKHVTSASLCALPILAAHAAPLSPAEAGLKFITAFRDCQIHHDVPACSGLVAKDAVLSLDNGRKQLGREFLRELAEPQASPLKFSEPEDVDGWRVGDMLFFNYVSVRTETYGQQPYRMRYRATMVLRESPTGTQLQLFQATLIPNTQRTPARIDPAAYDPYVGEYSAGPGDSEVVTREGGKLWITMEGSRLELLPSGADSFYIRGEGDEWFFIRDAKGNVTGLESRLWGQNILAPRVKS